MVTAAGRRHTGENKVTGGARHAIASAYGRLGTECWLSRAVHVPAKRRYFWPTSHLIIRAGISGVLSNWWPICKRAGQQGGHYLRRFG